MPAVGTTRIIGRTCAACRQSKANRCKVSRRRRIAAKEKEVARANTDAILEFACRFIVMRSLPGWFEEIYAEHLQSTNLASRHTKKPDDQVTLRGVS